MRTQSLPSMLRKGTEILRHEGVIPTARAGLRVIGLNYQGYYYYARSWYRTKFRKKAMSTDPFTVLRIPPERIQGPPTELFYRWEYLGEARPGEWDQTDRSLDDLIKYRSVINHFRNGLPWPETDVYLEAIKRVENGETYWNGCRTKSDVEQRARQVDQLYTKIKSDGYYSQAEIHDKPLRSIVLNRHFDRSKEEVAVAIGRDGEFLFIDGNHRLAIATVLGLDQIPVHVVTRHTQWQTLRNEVAEADNRCNLSRRAITHLSHPDMPEI